MRAQQAFSTQSLVVLLVANAILVALALALPGAVLVVAGAGVALTLAAWLGIRTLGQRAIEAAAGTTPAVAPPAERKAVPPSTPAPPRAEKPAQPPEAAAVQLLSILQREGRLLDFLQEDIRPYEDAQIGAAVRTVHEGCRSALAEHITLEPVRTEAEGSRITLPAGFDADAVRLVGNVSGEPPFEGELRHRGWRVSRIALPELMRKQERIVAPAEVEVR